MSTPDPSEPSSPTPPSPASSPGARIEMDGTLNLRDLGGWPLLGGGSVSSGRVYRSDRLSDLSEADHGRFDRLGIGTVIDLRSQVEVKEHPSRLWTAVTTHHNFAIGGDIAQQKSFIDQVLDGEFDGIDEQYIGESYIEMLQVFAEEFGQAVTAAIANGPTLFHCTAGKDRTGLVSMLLLAVVGVDDEHILTDFTLSNAYRAETRIAQLASVFSERGLDVEDYRAALSAPQPAMEMALDWMHEEHDTAADYLLSEAGVDRAVVNRIGERLAI